MPSTITSRLEGLTTSVAMKAPCRLRATANHPLSGLAAIDGENPEAHDRILVAANSDPRENGIWLAQSGEWTRAADFDGSLDAVCGTTVFVHSGATHGGTFWRIATADPIVIGTSAIEWTSAPVALVMSDGMLAPEQFGAVGYTTAAAAKTGVDNRAAFQAAITALVAQGGGTIVLTRPHYGFAAAARTLSSASIASGLEGVGLIIDGAHIVFKSTCGGTDIWRCAQGMADPAVWANWPLLSSGAGWRGGGLFLKGKSTQPTDFALRSGVTLDGVRLQGGITRGSTFGAFNTATGDGWDTTDKGIWTDNATVDGSGISTTGDIRIINGGGVIGFRGELVYAPNNTDCTLHIRSGTFGETNAQCLNPNSCNVDIDGLYGYNAYSAFEGWGGKSGRIVNATFENCVSGATLQGGKFGAGTFSAFYAPTRVIPTVTPYCHMDNLTFKNAIFKPGSWLDIGKVTLIDCQMIFENYAFQDGIIDTRISEVVFVTDQSTGVGIVYAGGDGVSSASQSIQDLKIDRVSFQRTKEAR